MDWIIRILSLLLGQISGQLREAVKKALDELEEKAKGTANPLDDFFVRVLKIICGMD